MNFELSEDQRAFVESARQFSERELAPHAARWDAEAEFPVDVIRKAADMGFCGLYVPTDQGGLGLSRLDSSLVFEQLAMGCTSTTAYLTVQNMVTWMIASFASKSVADDWVPRMVAGETLGAYCLTEPGSGSDAGSLKTRAERSGDDYVLNGTKMFISGASAAGVFVVMARTGSEGPSGISAFVVPADASGISVGKPEEKMGWKSQPTCSVSFDNVRIPAHSRLGEEGEGFRFAMRGLDGGRINIATCSLGTAQQALNEARDYVLERQQFGKPISQFQGLQFKLADMATELVAARQLVRLAAAKLDNGDPEATAYCAMAKRFATDVGYRVCDEALQLFGGYGYIREYPAERHLRDARVHRILEGTNEIMRVIVARRLLAENAGELL
ncbi:MAG: acyl-CoA dehydrogenase family protein [Natronospirillum sp.]|uniref:acyl-CoA dehydrogenase family protein n=1 Tax=Natronospirillum sp. TaxID=2812955 RepID=UPI0025DAE1EB|nr:acyl-CoA dehydrogenase family protein [Natronospirillum sp.]MCH8551525.1 acyl-CoA dehydrogenase family protein [Natronospirillum sp.]